MSVQAITWVIELNIPVPGQKLALFALANYATKTGLCFPGQETLAKDTSQGTRTVRRHLAALEQAGFIKRTRRSREDGSRTSDEYQLNMPAAKLAGSEESQPAKTGKPSGQIGQGILEPSENHKKESLSQRARATRLPENWQLSEKETNYARQKGLSENEISRLRDDIVDWSQSSPNGAKLNWRATWQTWVRRFVDERESPGQFGQGPSSTGQRHAGSGGRGDTGVVAALRTLKDRREAL